MASQKHHIEVFSTQNANGEIKFKSKVVSQKEAARRCSQKEHIVNRENKSGWDFVCSLCKGDYVRIVGADGQEYYFRLMGIEQDGRVLFHAVYKRVEGKTNRFPFCLHTQPSRIFADHHPEKVRVFLNEVRVVKD